MLVIETLEMNEMFNASSNLINSWDNFAIQMLENRRIQIKNIDVVNLYVDNFEQLMNLIGYG